MDQVRTETIREKLQVLKTLVDRIEENQISWYGHMQKMDGERLPKRCFNCPRAEEREVNPDTDGKMVQQSYEKK